MPLIPFEALPDDARVWVFGSTRRLADDAATRLLDVVDRYLDGWKAHGAPLTVGRLFVHEHFLAVGVDQSTAGASGCSIDALYRTLHQLEAELATVLLAGGRVFWREGDGIHAGDRATFTQRAADGAVGEHTPVFDLTVTTAAAFRAAFEQPACATWHAQLLPPQRATGALVEQ
jgi:hypothetical protein